MLNTLNVGQSGLTAARVAVENVSNNIANADTPGYKKRVVDLSELEQTDSRFTGRGVSATDAYRITSQYSYNNLISEGTKSSYYDEVSNILANVEASFGETDTSGFSSDLNRYFQSVENLRSNPNSEIYKADLTNQGEILVDALQNLYTSIEDEEKYLSNSLGDDVEAVNNILNDIGKINEQLGKYDSTSNDLLDKRDQLENKLSQYVDITVDTSNEQYQLDIGGFVAIRFNTNVREISFQEENTTQIDKFLKEDGTGSNILEGVRNFDENDSITYKLNNEFSVSVQFGEQMNFDLDGDGIKEDITVDDENYVRALVNKINTNTDTTNLITAYNGPYQTDEDGIKTVVTTESDKYLNIESNIPGVKGSFEGRITVESKSIPVFASSINDIINTSNAEVTVGSDFETMLNDPTKFSYIGNDNYKALTDEIVTVSTEGSISHLNYETISIDATFPVGSTITLTSDIIPGSDLESELAANFTTTGTGVVGDVYISTSSLVTGDLHIVEGESFILENSSGDELNVKVSVPSLHSTDDIINRENVYKDDYQSSEATSKEYMSIYSQEVSLTSGSIKAKVENLSSEAGLNKFDGYKEKLDNFARTLSDITDKYVKLDDNENYLYGEKAGDEYDGLEEISSIGLFSGADVKSLTFNENVVSDLKQDDLDYLSMLQWKKDISFNSTAQDSSDSEVTSFADFFQELRVNISSDKESNDFLLETQESVVQSLQSNYDNLVMVDKDEEMLNLIKFQAAYTASAKIISTIDEMLQTLLGLKR